MSDVDKRFIKFIVWSFVFCGLGVAFCTTILDISFSASVYAIFVIFLLVLILLPIIWWIGSSGCEKSDPMVYPTG